MTIATIAEAQQLFAQGKGVFIPGVGTTAGAGTAGAAASGQYSVMIAMNNIGTTLPGTRVGFQLPPALPSPVMVMETGISRNSNVHLYLCYLYRIGSVNLAATGDQFTHDAATFPILRTEFGEASKPVTLIPVVYIDDAGTVTAPVFSFKTNAGGAGYVDQDGNNEVATRTMTLPSATANVQSGYIVRLNDCDSGIRDVIQVDVDTASGSAASCVIFGAEVLADVTNVGIQYGLANMLTNGLGYVDLKPGTATSGTANALLCVIAVGSTVSSTSSQVTVVGALNA